MDGNGAVSLVLSSNRWMTLRGSNSYSGGTTVLPDGNLVMAETGVPGLGTLTLAGGIMWMDESLAVPVDNAIHLTTNSTLAPFFSYADEVTPEFTTHSFTATGGALRLENLRFQGSGLFEPRFSGSIHCDHPITMTNSGANRLRLGAFSTNGVFQNFVGGISGTGGFRRGAKAGLGGTTFLGGANTYTGETLVDNGTLILQGLLSGTNTVTVTNLGTLAGGGSVSGPVQVQAGGALSPGVAVGGPVARLTISNTLTLASGTTVQLRLSKADGTNDSVVGLSTVTYGGKLVVTNRAGDLAAGDAFKLFDAATYSGQFDAIEPATPGPGLVWDLTGLTNHGTLEVVAVRGPVIDTVTFHGAELVVSGSGGVPNGEYLILTATNAALAADLWWPLATNRFDGAGGFMFTTPVLLAEPDRYYRLASP